MQNETSKIRFEIFRFTFTFEEVTSCCTFHKVSAAISSIKQIHNLPKSPLAKRGMASLKLSLESAPFFCHGFLSQTFTVHRTAGEGGEAISVTPLYLGITRAITVDSSPLHISSSQIKMGIFGFQAKVAKHYAMRQNLFVC